MAYHHGNLREALLERAAEVIAEHGIEGLSLRALARDLDVSHSAPARHFADRSELLVELAQAGFRRSIEAMDEGADRAGTDPIARYRALGRSYVRFAMENPSYFRAITHPDVVAHGSGELQNARRAWFARLREGAEAARSAGWHPECDPAVLITFSCAAAMGTASFLSDPSWRAMLGGDDIETLADAVLDLTVHRSRTTPLRANAANEKTKHRRKSS
jgi:AcrR family transcriptional regulator